jgi:hypothetical protein
MAPIKFEEHLKDKLEKRTIKPSADAWDVLSSRLNRQDKKHNNRTFWWLGIAASIVGVMLFTAFIFNGSKSETITPTVVEIDTIEASKSGDVASESTDISEPKSVADVKNAEKTISKEVQTKIAANSSKDIIEKGERDLENALALQEVKEQGEAKKSLTGPMNALQYEQSKVNDVVAEITRLNTENQGVTEAEIDSLLKQAQRDILKNRIYNESTRTVDANALLQDVESELDQSFRTRVFEALKNSYVTVKTAVAERNN